MREDLLEAWRINDRTTRFLLDAIPPDAFGDTATNGGYSVGEQFADIQAIRANILAYSAPDLRPSVSDIDGAAGKDALKDALAASGAVLETLFGRVLASGEPVPNFPRSPAALIAYAITHEAYHRAEIGIILAQAGHPLDDATQMAMWQTWWGGRDL